jgi:hypothetical protein
MERRDAERKFRGNVGKRWGEERVSAILEALWALDRTPDITQLLGKLAVDTNL